jgi:hypothetical protein
MQVLLSTAVSTEYPNMKRKVIHCRDNAENLLPFHSKRSLCYKSRKIFVYKLTCWNISLYRFGKTQRSSVLTGNEQNTSWQNKTNPGTSPHEVIYGHRVSLSVPKPNKKNKLAKLQGLTAGSTKIIVFYMAQHNKKSHPQNLSCRCGRVYVYTFTYIWRMDIPVAPNFTCSCLDIRKRFLKGQYSEVMS